MVDLDDMHASERLVIEAAPETLYDIVSDMTRMGELSPVCTGAVYDKDDARGAGAWFTGRNETPARRWETRCQVVRADRPWEISWEMCGGRLLADGEPDPTEAHEAEDPVSRWSYRFRAVENGTEVEESWRLLAVRPHREAASAQQQREMVDDMRSQMRETLANLARVASARTRDDEAN